MFSLSLSYRSLRHSFPITVLLQPPTDLGLHTRGLSLSCSINWPLRPCFSITHTIAPKTIGLIVPTLDHANIPRCTLVQHSAVSATCTSPQSRDCTDQLPIAKRHGPLSAISNTAFVVYMGTVRHRVVSSVSSNKIQHFRFALAWGERRDFNLLSAQQVSPLCTLCHVLACLATHTKQRREMLH